ncbi:MAG: glycosyltransferase family 1 protein [Proteobacteria bacterium]|nr:glycosyltransferase family 1 protein [Pseudomonadota bacterium]
MRTLIMKGQSQYGGTRLFCDHAARAFARRGHQVEVLDLGAFDNGGPAILAHAASAARYDLVFTINIAGEFRDSLGRTIPDLYGGPHVVWHTDYILSQVARLHGTPKSTAMLMVDPTQVAAVKSIYGEDRFDHLGFFPHPAVGEPAPDDLSVDEFMARRPIEVLWSGSFQQPQAPWAGVEGPARQVLQDALDLALSVEWAPPHEALDFVLKSRGLDLADPANRGAREAAYLVDLEVRKTRRHAFLEAVAATDVPVRICGAGWESELHRFRNAVYEGPVEMTRMAELMAQSRLVLNTNGNFGAGSHERPFSASLAGAATFSDFSHYYARVFRPGENIELFCWQDLDAGMAALSALVADPERSFAYARSAKAETLAHHTWDQRVGLILAAADAVRR